MIGAARQLHTESGIQVVVGVASILETEFVRSFLRDDFPVTLVRNATHDVMANANLAIVTSGTATLETACYGTPMIVVYRTSPATYAIGRMLVKVKNIGLVNIVAGREIVPELIQRDVTPEKISRLASGMLGDEPRLKNITAGLAHVRSGLGTVGASKRVAAAIRACALTGPG
jgi:lipid-A-disaccharide synthase